jgi:hypothetical protein
MEQRPLPPLNITLKVPYNWQYTKTKPLTNFPPFGYGNYSNYNYIDHVGPQWWIPLTGVYPLYKEYRMDITYDSIYSFQRNKTSVIGPGASTYALVLSHDWQHPLWHETLEELAPDRGLINLTGIKNGHDNRQTPKETDNYVPLNLDLSKLNLPDQFYVTFSTKDAFLHNGLLCTLTDRTPFVAVPPPAYTLSLTDNFIKGLRPGDAKDVGVKLYSNTSLPFEVSFSTEEQKGVAGLTFKPSTIHGLSRGFVDSFLHIETSPSAAPGLYPIPVSANILLRPALDIANPDFSTPANLNKTADLIIEILPPKDSLQEMSEAWNTWGNSLNGFLGLAIAILGVGGSGIGALFLSSRRRPPN